MKESLRAIFAGDLEIDEVNEMLDHWCKRASRSRLPSFIRLSKTIRTHREGILASIRLRGLMGGSRDSTHEFAPSLPARMGFTPPRLPWPW